MSLLGNIVSGAGRVASLVPGVGTIAGAGLNALGGAIGASINQADDRSYAQQLWDKQNSYNDPSAQADRLKKAGLNPNMVFGQVGSSGAATTMPDSVKVSDSNSQNHAMDAISSMMMLQANTANINAQADKARADANLASVNAKKLGGVDTANVEAITANLTADANLKKSQSVAQDMTNRINATLQEPRMSAEIDNLVSQTLKNNADRDLAKKNLTKVAQDIIESAARTANYKIQTYQMSRLTPLLAAKLGAEINLTDANTQLVNANTDNTKVDTALNKNELDFQNQKDNYGRTNYFKQRGYQLRNLKLDTNMNSFNAANQGPKAYLDAGTQILNALTGLGSFGISAGNMMNGIERNSLFKQQLYQPTVTERHLIRTGHNSYSHTVTHR